MYAAICSVFFSVTKKIRRKSSFNRPGKLLEKMLLIISL
jgi:hypothetical protein